MNSSPFARIAELAAEGLPFAVATVVRTQGSTPQVAGAKLVVTDDRRRGRPARSAAAASRPTPSTRRARCIAQGGQSLRAYELTEELAWNTGLVCGGTMWILAERGTDALDVGGRSMLRALVDAATGGAPIAIVTRLRRRGRELAFAGRLFVDADGPRDGHVRRRARPTRAS